MIPMDQPNEPFAIIFEILSAAEKAKSVQEIADELKISYVEAMEHLTAVGKNVQLQYIKLPDGTLTVEISGGHGANRISAPPSN
jgi:hypothetical protein